MRNTRSRLVLVACALVITIPAASAGADDGAPPPGPAASTAPVQAHGASGDPALSEPVSPHGQLTSDLKQTQLEVGLDMKWDDILRSIGDGTPPGGKVGYRRAQLRLYGRVPVAGEGSTSATLDRFSREFHLGVRGALIQEPPGGCQEDRIATGVEYGFGRYAYSPNGDDTAMRNPIEQSFDLMTEYRHAWYATCPGKSKKAGGRDTGEGVVPQVRLKYARDWQASDKVGVVVPGMAPAPDITRDVVIAPPTVSPSFEL